MTDELMTRCEQRRQYKTASGNEWKWIKTEVSDAAIRPHSPIRCLYCHGAVTLHRQGATHSAQDHVKHKSRQDSEGCKGGAYYDGNHRMSTAPVED